MRIAMLTDSYLPKMDGVAVSVQSASSLLAAKGHKILIVAPAFEGYKDRRAKNIRYSRIRSFIFPSYPEVRFAIPHLRKTRDLIKDFKPDIIHTHGPGTLGMLGLFMAEVDKIPIVSTYHTSLPDMLVYVSPAKLLKLDKLVERFSDKVQLPQLNIDKLQQKIERYTKKLRKGEPLSRRTVWAASRAYYNRVDLVIAPSGRIEKELKKHKITVPVKVVSNGIHLQKFRKKSSYKRFPKFLHVGRVAYEKRIDIVLKAMAIVVKKYPRASLTIVGSGPAESNIKKLTHELKLSKHVELTGFIDRDRLPAIYRKHDVFVTASEMETQGLVLIEALACGLPVIGANVLAIPDVVHNQKTGFLVPKQNPERMAGRMCFIIENPEKIKEMGMHARKEAEGHDVYKVVDELERVYLLLMK